MRTHFDFYGYNNPTSGKYYMDGIETYTLGEDFRTVKRFKEYKAVGFNIALLQHENTYNGENFQKSNCKKCMDAAYKAGIDKIIVSDGRLKALCEEEVLVGENGRFQTEEELEDFIRFCTEPYRNYPGFYGVQLFDEPKWALLKEYAHVYRAIKKLFPEMALQCNLLNLCAPQMLASNPSDRYVDYANYLDYFATESGIDYLMTDEYAFRRNNVISAETFPVYQIIAKKCKELGLELRLVMQSFSQEGAAIYDGKLHGGVAWRRMTEKDMYWQMNLAMGFGCKEFSFFTYFTKQHKRFIDVVRSDGIDGAAFINLDGTRTKLYYYTKRIVHEILAFEQTLIKYNFDEAYFFFPKGKTKHDFAHTENVFERAGCPISVNTPKSPVLVTELKDGENRLFMVENVGNTIDELLYGQRATNVEIDLGEFGKSAIFYFRGKQVKRELVDGKFVEKMHCGDAIFIEVKA